MRLDIRHLSRLTRRIREQARSHIGNLPHGTVSMTQHFAELLMYTAPEPIHQASERWLARILEHLGLSLIHI